MVKKNAIKLALRLQNKGYRATILNIQDPKGRTWHIVEVGEYESRKQAHEFATGFTKKEGITSIVVPASLKLIEESREPMDKIKNLKGGALK